MSFEKAYEFTKKWEGGYVFDPSDPGGETNRGITDKRDGKVDGRVDVDADGKGDVSVKDLTEEQAKAIYKRNYWDVLSLDSCESVPMAVVIFDTSVNCGVARTAIWLDGAKTAQELIACRRKHYETIVQKNPKLKKFMGGWMNRIQALEKYLLSL